MSEKEKTIEEILKEIYNSETHLRIEWMWDGGIEVKQIWRAGKEDLSIGYHDSNPAYAIRQAYLYLKALWAENMKKELEKK